MKTTVEMSFDASHIPGGADAVLGPTQCGDDVAKRKEYPIDNFFEKGNGVRVELTLDNDDERVSKVLALLAIYGTKSLVIRKDIYTEDELQAAPLLVVVRWGSVDVEGGPSMGTSYDMTNACSWCGTGARQTSAMIVDNDGVRTMEKHRVGSTYAGDLLLRDEDVERLLAANVTGARFWPVSAKTKNGNLIELRRQQACIEHVMPPMTSRSWLNRKDECTTCHRGGISTKFLQPTRFFYRPRDLVDIQDFNLTWEWMGQIEQFKGDVKNALFPSPFPLITPKVMNLLRGKTKKEQKSQGCDFIPIWIEDEKT